MKKPTAVPVCFNHWIHLPEDPPSVFSPVCPFFQESTRLHVAAPVERCAHASDLEVFEGNIVRICRYKPPEELQGTTEEAIANIPGPLFLAPTTEEVEP